MSLIYDQLGDPASVLIAPTITLASLASSATVGRQSSVVTLIDGSFRVPSAIDIDVTLVLGTGTPANSKAAYVFMARTVDESAYEVGPPAVGASDAAFTFSSDPVSSAALPTDFKLVGVVPFNLTGQTRRRVFQPVFPPPPKFVLIVLNYSGVALASSGHSINVRKRFGEIT